MRVFFIMLICLPLFCFGAVIENARVWPSPDNTRVVFDLSESTEHSLFVLPNPARVVLDVNASAMRGDVDSLVLTDTGISRIRTAQRAPNSVRIVLDMTADMTPKSFLLPPNELFGHRLVVDLERPVALFGNQAFPQTVQAVATPSVTLDEINSQRRDIVVVIDAGHGGPDPGAIGPTGLYEKNVVLAISKEVYRQLDTMAGFKPIMVRDGDYIVALRERRNLARESNADLFVSIHADAFHKSSANGASVFALSQGGSVSAVARYLAEQENQADVIGGLNGVPLEGRDSTLVSVLVDMSMTSTVQRSLDVGKIILDEMGRFAKLHGNRTAVDQANFSVLRAPDVPSVLIETGFISNPAEEKNLGSAAYRKKMATAIRAGIVKYFERNPPEGSLVALEQKRKAQTIAYVVSRGDTLSDIADRHGLSLIELKALNGLSSNTIRVGQSLRVPRL